jgi:hypothetical protein
MKVKTRYDCKHYFALCCRALDGKRCVKRSNADATSCKLFEVAPR